MVLCVCVCFGEGDEKRENKGPSTHSGFDLFACHSKLENVCVCVSVKEKEREGKVVCMCVYMRMRRRWNGLSLLLSL